ncbi:MAG TPA: hypothetical protein VF974_00850 [Patescibacteria group bacterium]
MAAVTKDPVKRIEAINSLFDKVKKEADYYRRQCDQYIDHIANLEELIKDWSSLFEVVSNSTLEDLQEKTSKLLGEETP